jgi:hypothetical protein
MASQIPLVIVGGQIERLQSGDTLNAPVTQNDVYNLTAGTGNWLPGQAVYMSAVDTATIAKADAAGTNGVIGLASGAVTAASSGSVQTNGVIVLTTTQWDAVAGTTGGLVFNTLYYLSASTAGMITGTAPSTGYVVSLGRALSTTEMFIDIQPPIKL